MAKEKTIYNALPKLPGFTFAELHEPITHARRHYCLRSADGHRTVLETVSVAGANPGVLPEAPPGCGLPVRVILQRFPEWGTLDNKVLRFFGYYVEDVSNSQIESKRVRKVKLFFYLADGTLSIVETPAVNNSGLRKGTTVARFKPENVDVFSFCCGGSIACRGICYELVDCDAATREFYAVMGLPQPEPFDYPLDTFEASKVHPPVSIDEDHLILRRAIEVQAATIAGTHASLLTPAEREKARNYYEHDGDVLRYYASWGGRLFRVHYYLADNSISVMVDPVENDGSDPARVFIRRTRIPKDVKAFLLQTETLSRAGGAAPHAYVSPKDFYIGTTVDLFTRPFYIYDCDAHTRQYMKAQYGVDMPAGTNAFTNSDKPGSACGETPQAHNMEAARAPVGQRIGASTMQFEDNNKKKDMLKLKRFAHDAFRFAARIANPHACDHGRKFIITYYLADDTVSVHELAVRNSGHIGGRICSRCDVKGIDHPSKLQVGQVVHLNGVDYILEEMDQRTRDAISAGMPESLDDAYFEVLDLLSDMQQRTLQRFSNVSEAYRHYASSSVKGLTAENVKEMFTDSGIRLSPEMLRIVMKRVDSDRDEWVSLIDFTEKLLGHQFRSDFKPCTTAAALPMEPLDSRSSVSIQRGPIQSAATLAQRSNASVAAEEALRKLLAVTEARRTLLVRALRNAASSTYDGNLGMEDFSNCLRQRIHISLSDEELGALLYKFYYTPGVMNWEARRLHMNEVQHLIRL